MPRSYIFFGNGHPVAVSQAPDGLWEMEMGMSETDKDALSQQIASDISESALPQEIADAMWATNPSSPSSDEASLISAGVHAGTTNSGDQTTPLGVTGVLLFLNVTVAAGVLKTLKLDVEARDPVSAVYSSVCSTGLIGTTVTGVGTYLLYACPFVGSLLSGLFGSVIQLPRTWRCKVTPSDGSNWTYSVGRCYLR